MKRRPGAAVAGATALLVLVSLGYVSSQDGAPGERWNWSIYGSTGSGRDKSRQSPGTDPHGAYVKPTRQQLRVYVGENPKYLVKDSWAVYGYNNVRYMFEATLGLAEIVGRIPVIPDTQWARDCAVESATCTEYALDYFEHRLQHKEQMKSSWNTEGEAWLLGIENFVDIPHLRKTYGRVLTLSEFFTLYDIPPDAIDYSGRWDPQKYTPDGLVSKPFSREEFESPQDFIRLDRPFEASHFPDAPAIPGLTHEAVTKVRGGQLVWSIDTARRKLKLQGYAIPDDDDHFVSALEKVGQRATFTFHSNVTMSKALVKPVIDLVEGNRTRAFSEVLANIPPSSSQTEAEFRGADIVYLPGDLHDQRKAGAVRFSTPEARDHFSDLIKKSVRPPLIYATAAELLIKRIRDRVQGRQWLGTHMRRGDFVGIGWTGSDSAQTQLEQIRKALDNGVKALSEHGLANLPLPGDPFYVATDESNTTTLNYLRERGAILLSDLADESELSTWLGWRSSFTDLLALVEQEILAHADYFVGSQLSSTSGGIINMRAVNGQPDWSWSWTL